MSAKLCKDCEHYIPAMDNDCYYLSSQCRNPRNLFLNFETGGTMYRGSPSELRDGDCGPTGEWFIPKPPKAIAESSPSARRWISWREFLK